MSKLVFLKLKQDLKLPKLRLAKASLLAFSLFAVSHLSHAGQAVDDLSACLIKSTTATDQTAVLQWTFASLASHPDLKAFAHVTEAQKNQLDQKFAQTVQRIIVEQCASQAKAVIQSEGVQAVGQSFQALASQTGEALINTPEVKQQLTGTLRYIDLNKVMMTFLSPDLLNKLGL